MLDKTSQTNKLMLIFCIAILGTMILGCSLFKFAQPPKNTPPPSGVTDADRERWENMDAFKAKLKEFTTLPPKVQLTKEPYLKGKIVLYKIWKTGADFQNESILYASSPYEEKIKDFTAKAPDEVGTVILFEDNTKTEGCKEIRKGSYTVEGKILPGYVESCELTIIDLTIPAVVYRTKIEGKLDKTEFVEKGSGEVLGRIENSQVYDYLSGLPRR